MCYNVFLILCNLGQTHFQVQTIFKVLQVYGVIFHFMSNALRTSPSKKTPKVSDMTDPGGSSDGGLAKSNTAAAGSGNPEDPDHSILSDPEDYLEDDESLDMDLRNGRQKVWLVRLPRYLAEEWSKTKDLSGQRLGTVRIKQSPSGAGANRVNKPNNRLQVKLVLNKALANQNIPQEYDINMFNTQVQNSYVFSEENLKRFKQELTEIGEMPEQPELPVSAEEKVNPTAYYKVLKNREGLDGNQKYISYVKTIPKKTALVGEICHDCQIIPSKDDVKYADTLQRRRTVQPTKPRPKVTLLDEIPGVVQSNAGPSIRGHNNSVFLRSTNKAKNVEGRAIRMPKKDLLDLLFRLFDEYEYWSMKGLKERTRQPESYLKESLDSVANLIKKGPYTSKYHLKPEYRKLRDAERAARLGLNVNNNDDNKEADEENEDEMEDVI